MPTLPNTSGRLAGFSGDTLLPGGETIRGTNGAGTLANQLQNRAEFSPTAIWSVIWRDWDFARQVDNLDLAAAVGANVYRMHGSIYAVFAGMISRGLYHERWSALSEAATARGLFLYPVGCDGGSIDRFGQIDETSRRTELTAWAAHMQTLNNVIGLDVVQENSNYGASVNAGVLVTAIRNVTDLPITFSHIGSLATPYNAALVPRVDFIDTHIYFAPTTTTFDALMTTESKPFLVGEFGLPRQAGETAQLARYDAIRAAVVKDFDGRSAAGLCQWEIRDQDDQAGNHYGMWDNDRTERPALTARFRLLPGQTFSPPGLARKRLLNLGNGAVRIPEPTP